MIQYYLGSNCTMQRNTAVLIVICILLCLSFNCTFPLHRGFSNNSLPCTDPEHKETRDLKRTKKMSFNIENTFKKIKESTQDFGKNLYEHINAFKSSPDKNQLSEEDLRHYEQLVIMKKYPYLDLKELELKYNAYSDKHPRQSVKFSPGTMLGNDQGLCESLEDGPNVEVSNRGLSGFAMPPQFAKLSNIIENKAKGNVDDVQDNAENPFTQLSRKSTERKTLDNFNIGNIN